MQIPKPNNNNAFDDTSPIDQFATPSNLTVVTPGNKLSYGPKAEFESDQLADISDVYTKEGCAIAYLTAEDYGTALKTNTKQYQQTVHLLNSLPLLSEVSHDHLLYLAERARFEEYIFKKVIYEAGEQPSYWYLITKGEFQFFLRQGKERNNEGQMMSTNLNSTLRGSYKEQDLNSNLYPSSSPKGSNYVEDKAAKKMKKNKVEVLTSLFNLEAGQSFGQDEILMDSTRYCSVMCMSSENKVLKIQGEDLRLVLLQYPRITKLIFENIQQKKKIFDEVVIIKQKTQFNVQNLSKFQKSMHEPDFYNTTQKLPLLKASSPLDALISNGNNIKTYSNISKTLKVRPFKKQQGGPSNHSRVLETKDSSPQKGYSITTPLQQSQSVHLRQKTNMTSPVPSEDRQKTEVLFPELSRLDMRKNVSLHPKKLHLSKINRENSSGFLDPNHYVKQKQEVLRKIRGNRYNVSPQQDQEDEYQAHQIQSIDDLNNNHSNNQLLMPVKLERRHLLRAGKFKSNSLAHNSSKGAIRSKRFMQNFLKGVLMRKGAMAASLEEVSAMYHHDNRSPPPQSKYGYAMDYSTPGPRQQSTKEEDVIWQNPFDLAFFTPI